MATKIQLTDLASCGGCAGKAGPLALSQVLKQLTKENLGQDPNLLVGLEAPDDASVFKLNDNQAIVLTLDFFAPLVDDPYDYGAIAATNAMSDIYAMGGEVMVALNIAAFPEDLPADIIASILRGGADKVTEAGAAIAGGHTIIDSEPKYGLSVMGLIDPRHLLTKGGSRPGDALFLSKPLGVGVIIASSKAGVAKENELQSAIASMKQLNQHSSQVIRDLGAIAMTDVTGFGILGHSYEMAKASKTLIRISTSSLPILEGALHHANNGVKTSGQDRNWDYLQGKVRFQGTLSTGKRTILLDPQTSGGLLFSINSKRAAEVENRFTEANLPVWEIGEVADGQGVEIIA